MTTYMQWTPGAMAINWRDTSHGRHPIDEWISISVEQGKHPVGTLTIVTRHEAPWVQAFFAVSAGVPATIDPVNQCVELYYRDTTAPLFIGPIVKAKRMWGGSYPEGAVELTFELIWGHHWRRRICQDSTNAGFTAATPGQWADILGQRIMNDGLGLTYANGGMFTAGQPYSGTTTERNDTEAFIPWTVAVATIHSPQLSATSLSYDQQSGRNMLDTLLWVGDSYDIAYTWSETAAGTMTYDTTGTYQRTDLTTGAGAVVLGDHRHNILSLDHEYDYSATSNTWFLKGNAADAAQIKNWYQDTNADAIGIYENEATAPYLSSTTKLGEVVKPGLFNLYSEATQAISVEFIETDGALFNSTFGVRDLVTFASLTFGLSQSVLVVGYKMSIDASGAIKIDLTLNAPPHRITTLTREYVAGPGGRSGGGLLSWNRDG